MFGWSNNSSSSTTTTRNANYPGRRTTGGTTSGVAAARAVEGSIRPPSSSSASSSMSTTNGGSTGESYTRAQHLQSFLDDPTLKRSTRRVSSDDTTYDTVFQTTDGDTLILRVNVPLKSSFAAFCPAMTLAGVRLRHPWVDSSNPRTMRITGYGPILSEEAWKSSGILLGDAIHAVVKHLQLNPPQIIEITDKGLQSLNKHRTYSNANGVSSNSHSSNSGTRSPPRSGNGGSNHDDAPPGYHVVAESTTTTRAPEVPMPQIPKSYPEIKDMDRADLDDLLDDELEFLALVHKLKVFDQIFTIGSSRLNENVQLANDNISKEEKWNTLKSEVKELQKTLKTKVSNFNKQEEKQNAICAPPEKSSTLRKLNQAKKEAFEESETIAEEWVDYGGSTVDEFLKSFLAKRRVHHLRAAKAEILKNTDS
mmetsp:Transcript_59021/g.144408  ORF Transcript_59021/g.144408 Transcript_59021/m.144408 type:complete len:423 (-) Transcript_59021:45-1313(-)